MKTPNISIEKAKAHQLFYVVASVVVYRERDGRCLIIRRDPREKVYPGKWGVPGGKLEHADLKYPKPATDGVTDFPDVIGSLAEREIREESGVRIKRGLHHLGGKVFLRPDGVPVVLLRFAARYASGNVVLEKGSFSESAWVNALEIGSYSPWVSGVKREIGRTIAHFKGQK